MRKQILFLSIFWVGVVSSVAREQNSQEAKQTGSHNRQGGNDDSEQREEEKHDPVENFLRQIKGNYKLAPGQENTIKCRTLEELHDMETRFRVEVRNRDESKGPAGELGNKDVLFQRYYPEWGDQRKWAKIFYAADFTSPRVRKSHVGWKNVIEHETKVDVAKKTITHTVSDKDPKKGAEIEIQEMSFDPQTGDMTYSQFNEKRSPAGTLQERKPVCSMKFTRVK